MVWVYPMEEVGFADILTKGDWNNIQLKAGNTVINTYINGWEGRQAYAEVPENWNRNWHHIASVLEGDLQKIYVDGKLLGIKEVEARNPLGETGLHDYSGAPWNIGRNAASPDRIFKGLIDDVRVFETALSEEEIFKVMVFMGK